MIKAVILDDEIRGSNLLHHKLQEFQNSLSVDAIYNDPQKALSEIPKIEVDVLFFGC
ncbi:Uncharacterised protein [Sphingobacterium daejeonense]|nr:Uncharacterised protein [Sphingobacterium daejeonense]